MQRHYETVGIIKPDIGDDAVKAIIEKASTTVAGGGGSVAGLDEWGRRKLAYPIKKKNEGYYFVLTYTSEAATKQEIERQLRLSEDVMRYQTIVLDELPKAPEPAAEKPAEAAETAPEASSEGGESDE